jgi:hypothetical protein
MDRYLVISSDCHAGLQPQHYRNYLESKYHAVFDEALPLQIAAMLGGNAARVYGFDADKLAPLVAQIGPEKSGFA